MHKLIEAAVFAAIGVLVFASLLIPVVDDATATTAEIQNEGLYYIVNDNTSHSLVYDGSKIFVDGKEITTISPGREYTILAWDDGVLRNNTSFTALQLRGTTSLNLIACNWTIYNGTISGDYTTSDSTTGEFNASYSEYYLATVDKEALIMKDYTGTVALTGDSSITGRGVTMLYTDENHTPTFRYLQIDATIDGGATITVLDAYPDTWTVDNVQINTTPHPNFIGVYDFVSITFDVIKVSNSIVTPVTYSAVIVPASVTAEKAIHADEPTRDILSVLPLILICALIMGVLGYAVYSRIE